jgi:hypothetical protein
MVHAGLERRALAARHGDPRARIAPRILGRDADDAGDSVGTVQRRPRAGDDLDVLDVAFDDGRVHIRRQTGECRCATVDQRQQAIAPRRVEAPRIGRLTEHAVLVVIDALCVLDHRHVRSARSVGLDLVGGDLLDRGRRIDDALLAPAGRDHGLRHLKRRFPQSQAELDRVGCGQLDRRLVLQVADEAHGERVLPRRQIRHDEVAFGIADAAPFLGDGGPRYFDAGADEGLARVGGHDDAL